MKSGDMETDPKRDIVLVSVISKDVEDTQLDAGHRETKNVDSANTEKYDANNEGDHSGTRGDDSGTKTDDSGTKTDDSGTKTDDSGTKTDDSGTKIDPWALPHVKVEVIPWSDLSTCSKIRRVLWDYIGKCLLLIVCLYFFVCSLGLLSSAFRLLGGKTAGSVLKNNSLLSNPVAGLMIGVLSTVLLQSSSTTTGIVISLVVSEVLEVREVIPIVMGANIGTSVTNTIVSMGQITKQDDFRRAFAGATVHDMFNWMSVLVLLPVEVATGYLYYITRAIVESMHFTGHVEKRPTQQLLKTVTKPFTSLIIKIDKNVLKDIAKGTEGAMSQSIIKRCCKWSSVAGQQGNLTLPGNQTVQALEKTCVKQCKFMFQSVTWSDTTVGIILLVLTLLLLCACFFTIVRTLYSVLKGQILLLVKKFINANFPGKLSFLTGYIAIIIGTGITMVVQSSSVVTSALTPLVGIGILSVERMYPLTLGANLGTTFTAIIIALSQSQKDMSVAFHVALCHLFFNISGVLIFYPLPFMRVPIRMAKFLGNETAKYRWFGLAYMIATFFVLPAIVFALSTVSWIAVVAVLSPVVCVVVAAVIINVLQTKKPSVLPRSLRTWKFLPVWMRSLAPYDRWVRKLAGLCTCCSKRPPEAAAADDTKLDMTP